MKIQTQLTFARKLRPSRLLAERYGSVIMLQHSWNVATSRIAEYLTALEADCGIHEPRKYTGAMVRTAINIIKQKRADSGRPRSKKQRSV